MQGDALRDRGMVRGLSPRNIEGLTAHRASQTFQRTIAVRTVELGCYIFRGRVDPAAVQFGAGRAVAVFIKTSLAERVIVVHDLHR